MYFDVFRESETQRHEFLNKCLVSFRHVRCGSSRYFLKEQSLLLDCLSLSECERVHASHSRLLHSVMGQWMQRYGPVNFMLCWSGLAKFVPCAEP